MGKILKINSNASEPNWHRSKAAVKTLGDRIKEYETLNEEPECFIKSTLQPLREQLQIDKESSLKEVEDHYSGLERLLDQIEGDCVGQSRLRPRCPIEAEIYESYGQMRKNLEVLIEEDAKKQHKILSSCNRYLLQLEKMTEDLKTELFLRQSIQYRANVSGLKYSLESVEILAEPAKRSKKSWGYVCVRDV